MTNFETIAELEKQLDAIYSEMPQTFFQMEQRNKSAFLICRQLEKLKNPKDYKENELHWESYQMNF